MTMFTAADAANLFRAAPHRFLDVGAGEVAYRQVGSGPDVLFVHGWPVSGATFRTLLPHLVGHVTCHVIDLPGAGSSRYDGSTELSIDQHIATVRRVVDLLELDRFTVVGHDSGGMIARHALAGDARVAAMALMNTEQPPSLNWRFKQFLAVRHLPGIAAGLGWVAGRPRLRRSGFVFGDAFADRSRLEGEFDEFFLQPLRTRAGREAAVRLLRSFDERHVRELTDIHARIAVPVQLVWGNRDPFFPIDRARAMVGTFPDAQLTVIEGAGLFCHEENPEAVAMALTPVLADAAS